LVDDDAVQHDPETYAQLWRQQQELLGAEPQSPEKLDGRAPAAPTAHIERIIIRLVPHANNAAARW
jgi:hypothetical protein